MEASPATSPSDEKERANISRPASGSHSHVLSFNFYKLLVSEVSALIIQRPTVPAPDLRLTASSPTKRTAEGLMWVEQPTAHALTAGQWSSSPQPGSQPHPRLLPGGAPALRGKGGLNVPQGRSSWGRRCPPQRGLAWPGR